MLTSFDLKNLNLVINIQYLNDLSLDELNWMFCFKVRITVAFGIFKFNFSSNFIDILM